MVFWLSTENFLMSSTNRKWKRLLEAAARLLAPSMEETQRTLDGVWWTASKPMAVLLHPAYIQKKAPGGPSALGGRGDLWYPSHHASTPADTSVFMTVVPCPRCDPHGPG